MGVIREGTCHGFILNSKEAHLEDPHFCISELLFSLNSIIHSWNLSTPPLETNIEGGISILGDDEKL